MKKIAIAMLFVLMASVVYGASVTLQWTAPADDDGIVETGSVDHYELRWFTSPPTEMLFNTGTLLTTGTPKKPGEVESYNFNLMDGAHYYFAIKSFDRAGNQSAMSNIVAHDFFPPSPVGDLR